MNRIIAIIVACIAVIAAVAQEKADIEVSSLASLKIC